jgi:hypothetical protein
LLLVLTFPVLSQETFYLGIKGGLNLSDIALTNYVNPDAESDYNIKAGVHAGLFGNVEIGSDFLLGAELLYSNQGVVANDRINLHYITVPLLIQYRFHESFIAEVGPQFGYLLAARSRYGNVSNTWNNKLDIGLNAGVQYLINERFSAGLRYYAGFSSVINSIDESGSNNIPTEETIKYQNRVLQLSLFLAIVKRELHKY